jgi:hypothetical protein
MEPETWPIVELMGHCVSPASSARRSGSVTRWLDWTFPMTMAGFLLEELGILFGLQGFAGPGQGFMPAWRTIGTASRSSRPRLPGRHDENARAGIPSRRACECHPA